MIRRAYRRWRARWASPSTEPPSLEEIGRRLREQGFTVTVTSGYRSSRYNAAVGEATSDHHPGPRRG